MLTQTIVSKTFEIIRKIQGAETPEALLATLDSAALTPKPVYLSLIQITETGYQAPVAQGEAIATWYAHPPHELYDQLSSNITFSKSQTPSLWTAEMGRPIISTNIDDDVMLDQPLRRLLIALGLQAGVLMPLFSAQIHLGWLLVAYNQPYKPEPADISCLDMIAFHIATSWQNQQLRQHQQTRQQQLAQVQIVTAALTVATNIEAVFAALTHFSEMISATAYGFYVVDDLDNLYHHIAHLQLEIDLPSLKNGPLFQARAYIANLDNDPHWRNLFSRSDELAKGTLLVAPLDFGQHSFKGLLLFAHHQPDYFAPEAMALVDNVALQASLAIKNVMLVADAQASIDEAQIMVAASHALSGTSSLADVYQAMGQIFVSTGVGKCTLAIYVDLEFSQAFTQAQVVEICGPASNSVDLESIGQIINLTESPHPYPNLQRSLNTGRIVTTENQQLDANLNNTDRTLLNQAGIMAQAIIPLFSKQNPIGFVVIEYTEPHHFTKRQLSLLRTIANQTTIAIEHNQQITLTERWAKQVQTGAEISRIANSILSHEKLIEQAVNLIGQGFDFYYVGLFLVDDAGDWAILQAGTGQPGQDQVAQTHKLKLDESSMIGWCVTHKEAKINLDVGPEAVRFNNPHLPETRSEMALPLISRSIVLGAISIQSQHPAAFSQNDVVTLQIMTDQLANALLNSRLFQNALDAQQKTENLYLMSRQIAAAHTINEAASIAVIHVPKRNLDKVGICFIDQGSDLDTASTDTINLIALWCRDDSQTRLSDQQFSVEQIPFITQAKSKRLIIIEDVKSDSQLDEVTREAFTELGIRSAVIIPIVADETILGWLIAIKSDQPETYLIADIAPLQAVCDQIGVVIDRIQKTASLLKSSQQYLSMVANIPGGVYRATFDGQYRLNYISQDIIELTGYSVEEFLDTAQDLIHNIIHPEDRNRVETFHRNATRNQQPFQLKYRIQHKSGDLRFVAEHGKGLFDKRGLFSYIDGILFDETERETLQRSFQRRAAQFEAITEVGHATSAILNVEQLIQKTVEKITQAFGFYYAGLFLLDAKQGWAVLQGGSGDAGKTMVANGHRLKCDETSMVGWATYNGKARIALDVGAEPHRFDNPYLPETHSEIALPLISRGRVIGALDVQSQVRNAFSQDDITTLQLMANQLAHVIENVSLIKETQLRANQLQISTEISQIVTAHLDQHLLLNDAVELIRNRFNFSQVNYYLIDAEEADSVVLVYQSGALNKEAPALELTQPDFASNSLIQYALTNEKAMLEYESNSANATEGLATETTQPVLIIPVRLRYMFVGVLEIYQLPQQTFSQDLVAILEVLGSQIATSSENARAYQTLQDLADRLREVDKLKNQFLANMSHELRTPLNSIIGFSRVILKGIDGPLTDLQETDLQSIYQSGQHLLGLINDILDLAKIEAGKLDLIFEKVDVRNLINGVTTTATGLVKDKPITVTQRVAPNLPLIMADETKIRQVLLNLVSNAAKFTEKGEIIIDAAHNQKFVIIKVIDTGIGIPEENLEAIFNEFTQVDSSTTRQVGGTGLGLSITKKLIELHHGQILANSRVNIGTTFTVVLPIAQPVNKGEPLDWQAEDYKTTILVIDEDSEQINQYRQMLGHSYEVVVPSEPVLDSTIVASYQPTVIVVDVTVQSQDGWALIKILRETPTTATIPIIICSNTVTDSEAKHTDIDSVLTKPVAIEVLQAYLKHPQPSAPTAYCILMIDENVADVAHYKQLLAAKPYHIVVAHNGIDGLEAVGNHNPDLIILNLTISGLDSFSIIDFLKSKPEMAMIPLIILTPKELNSAEESRLASYDTLVLAEDDFSDSDFVTYIEQAFEIKAKV